MIKLILKSTLYFILILVILEVIVRVFHLYNEFPEEYVTEEGLYKWIPNQNGYTVYGNRRQQFSEYKINNSGYNSYREFEPTKDKFELAILGDSYIEGFHQDFNNSVGKKIEEKLDNVEVYEYGHSANDLADQLYLMHKNEENFSLIDHIIIRIKYEKDLRRKGYYFVERKPLFMAFRRSKLVIYLLNIGAMEPLKGIHRNVLSLKNKLSNNSSDQKETGKKTDIDSLFLENFKTLTAKYDFNKDKTTLLIDSRVTNEGFVNYLKQEHINFIDYSHSFEKAGKKPTTLIYDQHWNNYGRTLIAQDIAEYLSKQIISKK